MSRLPNKVYTKNLNVIFCLPSSPNNNKTKVEDPELNVSAEHLMKGKYLLAQKGKKNYYLVTVE